MTIGYNIWVICSKLNWFFYDASRILQLSEFVWALRSSVWVVLNNFLLIDATDSCKIRSDQKRLFFAVSLYPLSFFANTPFNICFSPHQDSSIYCPNIYPPFSNRHPLLSFPFQHSSPPPPKGVVWGVSNVYI